MIVILWTIHSKQNSGPYSLMDDLAKKSEHRREPESLEMDQNYYSNDDGNDMTKSQEGTKRDSGKKYSGSQVSTLFSISKSRWLRLICVCFLKI